MHKDEMRKTVIESEESLHATSVAHTAYAYVQIEVDNIEHW